MPPNWENRDRKLSKRRSLEMVVDGRSTKTVLGRVTRKGKDRRNEKRRNSKYL